MYDSYVVFVIVFQNLENYITNILEFVVHRYYNNPTVREKALSKIPLELLKENAQQNLMNNDPEISLLRELMCWFTTFFKWIDTPECSNCGAPRTVMTGYSNEPDHLIQTNRVEVNFIMLMNLFLLARDFNYLLIHFL